MPAKLFVLIHKPDPAALPKAGELRPAHIAHFQDFHARGKLVSFGPFADLMTQGSMSIFPTREDAEAFVEGDPFTRNGVVASHKIREWTDVVA